MADSEIKENEIRVFVECGLTSEGEHCQRCSKYIDQEAVSYSNQESFAVIWERTKKERKLKTRSVTGNEYIEINCDTVPERKNAEMLGQEYFLMIITAETVAEQFLLMLKERRCIVILFYVLCAKPLLAGKMLCIELDSIQRLLKQKAVGFLISVGETLLLEISMLI